MQTVEFTVYWGEDNTLNVIADVTPAQRGNYGPSVLPENAYPDEPAEVEILDCRIVDENNPDNPGVPIDPMGIVIQPELTRRKFTDLIRSAHCIDRHDVPAAIFPTTEKWMEFRDNPTRWLMSADPTRAGAVFKVMLSRGRMGPISLEDQIREEAIQKAMDEGEAA